MRHTLYIKTFTFFLGIFISLGLNAQVGINTSTPDASALLDLGPGNKGLLIPRVALTSLTDVTTIPNPTHGLMVYNTTNDPTKNLIANSFYYYNAEASYLKWMNFIDSNSVASQLENLKLPVYVGQVYKTNQQTFTSLTSSNVNIINFNSSPSTDFFNSGYIKRKTGSTTTFIVLKSGYYVFEGFTTWQFTATDTTFWTVAIESGTSLSDSSTTTPTTFTFGMRCPYYVYEKTMGAYSTCNFSGAVYLSANTQIRLIAVKKNGTDPTAAVLGDGTDIAAGLKVTFFP